MTIPVEVKIWSSANHLANQTSHFFVIILAVCTLTAFTVPPNFPEPITQTVPKRPVLFVSP